MLTSTIFLKRVSARRNPGWLYLSQDWSCLACDMRGSRFPSGCQWWIRKTRFLLKRWWGAKLVFMVLRKKKEQKVRTLLIRVAILMKILITSPLILKTWKPHPLSLNSNHGLVSGTATCNSSCFRLHRHASWQIQLFPVFTGGYAMNVGWLVCIHHHSDDISSRANHYFLHLDWRFDKGGLATLGIPIKKR